MTRVTPTIGDSYQRKIFLFCFLLFISSVALSQEYPAYDEFTVDMTSRELGTMEVPIAIKNEVAYISFLELFQLFQLKSETNDSNNTISGFVENMDTTYLLNLENNTLQIDGQEIQLQEDQFIQTGTIFYLRSDLFGKYFKLQTDFSIRDLKIAFSTELELPIIKQKRRDRARKNLNRTIGILEPDTLIERKYPFFKGGNLDWGITTTQQTNGQDDNRFNLGLGTMFAGGETNILLNYSDRVPFTSRNQFYQWKYVDNDSKLFKQVTAGKIFTGATSSLFAPVVGVQVTNAPLVNRRSYGTYILNDYTEPRWTVELYVNNILVDFTQADASGFYFFDVPLMYGNTNIDLRFFGPYGEELSDTRVINIPYNFVPENEFQYSLSAGVVEDEDNRRFSRYTMGYGLSRGVTIGGGIEYLSDVISGEYMPFLSTSVRMTSNLLFSGEYTYGVKGEGILSYRTPSRVQFDLMYAKYHDDQTAINYNYLEEREFRFSAPIRMKNFSAFSRFSLNQIVLPTTEFTTAQLLLSGNLFGISTNLTTYGIFNSNLENPTIYSSLSQTFRLPYQVLFSPQVQFDLGDQSFRNLNLELERVIFERGFLNLSYENNALRDAHTFEIGLRYAFNFAQTSVTSRLGNRNSSHIQSARGSVRWDDSNNYVALSNRPGVARGGITILPFLDLNGNGKRDAMEKGVSGIELKTKPGLISYNKDKTEIRLTDLQPYVKTIIEVESNSLDNIAWKVKNPKIMVETVPNQFKTIEIPVTVLGEVSGFVNLKSDNTLQGQGRIKVQILDQFQNKVTEVLSEGDGYFTYLGLKPGNYTARIDPLQLQQLGFKSSPASYNFEIEISEYGDIEDTIEFNLEKETEI